MYMLSRRASEVNQLDLQHYALREALGANYVAPVGKDDEPAVDAPSRR
jgi:hypothetical protein